MDLVSREDRGSIVIWGISCFAATLTIIDATNTEFLELIHIRYLIYVQLLLVAYVMTSRTRTRWKNYLLAVLSTLFLILPPTNSLLVEDFSGFISQMSNQVSEYGLGKAAFDLAIYGLFEALVYFLLPPTTIAVFFILVLNFRSTTRSGAGPVRWQNVVPIYLLHAFFAVFVDAFITGFALANP